jgi:hypothetical protein
MSLFPNSVKVGLGGGLVRAVYLFEYLFVGGAERVFIGAGDFKTPDDRRWYGLGAQTEVTGLKTTTKIETTEASLNFSGVDPEIAALISDEDDSTWRFRRMNVYLQVFGQMAGAPEHSPWKPTDNPYLIWWGLMSHLRVYRTAQQAKITLTAYNAWYGKKKPRFSRLTDSDQRARQEPATDTGLIEIPKMRDRRVIFPR